MIGNNPLTYRKLVRDRENRLVELVARHRVPTIHGYREFVTAGGLLSMKPSRRAERLSLSSAVPGVPHRPRLGPRS